MRPPVKIEPGKPARPVLSRTPRSSPASIVGYVTAFGIRRQRQSVTMIVTTKATRIASWAASSASIPLPYSRTKGRRSPSATPPSAAFALLSLGQVVPDVAEDVLDLAP